MLKKYLTAFDNDILYDAFKNSKDYITPNVSLIRAIKQLYFEKSVDTNNLVINGEIYTDKVITLAAGGTYEISGVHEGQIVIDAISVKPDAWTTIILDNATIVSDESYGILYDCPQSSNKGYQGLTITLNKDSQNFVVCNKETTLEGDETYASIDSWKDLTIQGVGYLAVYNNVAHGLRGETLNIAGPHVYTNVEHDGIHGKTVNVFDGVFYFQQAKDAFGTTETGKLNIFGGSFDFINVTQDHFDSKNTTKLGIYNVAGELPTNMVALEDYYNEGTVIAYRTKTDYEEKNGVVIEPSQQTIKEVILYNANSNGEVVAQTAPTGYTVPVVSKDSNDEDVILIPEQQMYVIGNEYNIVEVTGKITAPIVRPTDAIILDDIPSFSKKGKLNGGYDNNFDVYLNGAVIVTNGDSPSIANLPDAGRVKIIAVKETINAVINKYNGEGTADHDAIKSENNLPIEVKNESILYVTSVLGDGVDGGETTFTDSKGTFIASGCGERGVKGNAVVIGPNSQIDASIITSYITDPNAEDETGKNIYTTFDGIFVAKGNVTKNGNVVGNVEYPDGMTDKDEKEAYAKTVGFADVYGRNGKCTKGVFGTTDTELKGIAIIGSLTAYQNVDTGNAKNLHVNQILKPAANPIETVQEEYKVIPYKANPISKD
jgi:hypothetical protein